MTRGPYFVRASELYDPATRTKVGHPATGPTDSNGSVSVAVPNSEHVEHCCNDCSVRIVERDPSRTDLCPVCRTGSDPSNYPPISEVRGDLTGRGGRTAGTDERCVFVRGTHVHPRTRIVRQPLII
ncbi:hypothetical protein DU484_17505 [Haloplanus rubicundus]|uniref:Uncharacterized protein n=1 Tax=Haloplanus rubicundus TaxID=1547898 RepID=A0A345EH32_9EURY|nr:hypothetical protein DU484_17505 [Haloplanus rubicundus]